MTGLSIGVYDNLSLPRSNHNLTEEEVREIKVLRAIVFGVSIIGTGLVCFIVFFLGP